MITDARSLPEGTMMETDLCIVGAGAAGITLAQALDGHRWSVCLVESGGLRLERKTQKLYEAENVGLPYFPLDANRQRSFGGTTNLWGGWCRPMDEIDFEHRSWIPYSGWPITRDELWPFYRRAHALCTSEAFEYRLDAWEKLLQAHRLPLPLDQVESKIYHLSRPVHFGEQFKGQLTRSCNVQVLLHANAMEMETNERADQVVRLHVGCLDGKQFSVSARYFVLAAGGVENARLLLLSDGVQKEGLGNARGLVGRFFMEHLHFSSGTLLMPKASRPDTTLYIRKGSRDMARFFLTPEVEAREQLLRSNVMLEPQFTGLRFVLTAAFRHFANARRVRARPNFLLRKVHSIMLHGKNADVARRFEKPPSTPPGMKAWRLIHTLEQAPNPESRVTLSAERDGLGLRRARLDWRLSSLEQATFARVQNLLRAAFRRAGLGELRVSARDGEMEWPPSPLQGLRGHHIGTTRMSDNRHTGVVNVQGRVHGVDSLYITGSSVFPTAGSGIPTLTIIALALRLADHLKTHVSRQGGGSP